MLGVMPHGAELSPELIYSTVLTNLRPFASGLGTSDKKRKGKWQQVGHGTGNMQQGSVSLAQ